MGLPASHVASVLQQCARDSRTLHQLTLASRKPVSAAKIRLYCGSQILNPTIRGRPPVNVSTWQWPQLAPFDPILIGHVVSLPCLPPPSG
jgi:hypothetical protein